MEDAQKSKEGKKSGNTLIVIISGISLAILSLATVGVLLVSRTLNQEIREQTAIRFERSLEELILVMDYPRDEAMGGMESIYAFTKTIRDNEAAEAGTPEETEELANGILKYAIIIHGINYKYLQFSLLGKEEKKDGSHQIDRFIHGLISQKISFTKAKSILDSFTIKKQDPENRTILEIKPMITTIDLRICIMQVERYADKAQIKIERNATPKRLKEILAHAISTCLTK